MFEDEGELKNFSQSNLNDWVDKGRNCFIGEEGI